jgi:predicted DNA-binding WGR domain protein
MTRRFEITTNGRHHFWEVGTVSAGTDVEALTVRYGRIGAAGQSHVKELSSWIAFEFERNLINERLRVGYVEVTDSLEPTPPRSWPTDETRLVASPENSPFVLVSPPWLRKDKTEKRPVLRDINVGEVPDLIGFDERTLESWKHSHLVDRGPFDRSDALRCIEVSEVPIHRIPLFPDDLLEPALQCRPVSAIHSFYEEWVLQWMLSKRTPSFNRFVIAVLAADPSRFPDLYVNIGSTDLAGAVARMLASKAQRRNAQRWIRRFPQHGAAGLLPVALGALGKERNQAEKALRFLASSGSTELVREIAEAAGVAQELVLVLEQDPAMDFPTRRPSLPEWLDVAELPPVQVKGGHGQLSPDAFGQLLIILAFSRIEEPYVGLEEVREICTPESLDLLAWSLFEQWNDALCPSAQDWPFGAIGLIGGDFSVNSLLPFINTWPTAGAAARAKKALRILAAQGSDLALLSLHRLSEGSRKSLGVEAKACLLEIAETRGFSTEELADRLVPRFDLDTDGTTTLNFGPRIFRVGFDEFLQPVVSDEKGVLKALPKPGAKDDLDLANAATAQWKTLKRNVSAASKMTLRRLERAMVANRTWTLDSFVAVFLEHPLLVHVAKRLVWATVDGPNLVSAFRVAEDGSFADIDDVLCVLANDVEIAIPHPLMLTNSAAWGERFADYAILQPFPQLNRETYAITDAGAITNFERYRRHAVPYGRVAGLTTRGWERDEVEHHGMIFSVHRLLSSGQRVTIAFSEGFYATGRGEATHLPISNVLIGDAPVDDDDSQSIPLDALGAVDYSELVRDLETLLLP